MLPKESPLYWAQTGYANYYELGLQLLRPGGIVIVDNVLWGGSVRTLFACSNQSIIAFSSLFS